jgi:CheY-like chemotaxis protein
MPPNSDAGGNQPFSAAAGIGLSESYVLLIDDEEAILDVLSAVLRDDEGYEVLAVRSGREALSVAPQTPPSFIMMDVTLPNEKPDEVVRLLRGRLGWERVAVVICSAIPRLSEVAAQLGADDWLPKPFELDDLIAVARRFAAPPGPSDRQ